MWVAFHEACMNFQCGCAEVEQWQLAQALAAHPPHPDTKLTYQNIPIMQPHQEAAHWLGSFCFPDVNLTEGLKPA